MAKKKEKQEEIKISETKPIKQRRLRVPKDSIPIETIIEQIEEPIINEPIEEFVEQIIVEENPWKNIVSMAENLYITLEEEYKKQANNDISSMLILMSSVIKTAKKRI